MSPLCSKPLNNRLIPSEKSPNSFIKLFKLALLSSWVLADPFRWASLTSHVGVYTAADLLDPMEQCTVSVSAMLIHVYSNGVWESPCLWILTSIYLLVLGLWGLTCLFIYLVFFYLLLLAYLLVCLFLVTFVIRVRWHLLVVFDLHSHEDQDNSNLFSCVHWDQSIHFATSGISSSDPGRFLYAAPGLQVRSVKCFFLNSFLLSFVCVWYVCMCVCMFTTVGVNIHVHMPVKVGS